MATGRNRLLSAFTAVVYVFLFLPIVMAYTSWVYYVLRGPVTSEQIRADSDGHY